ncbi:MAG: L,D-transpeptidase family protein [Gaiellaceae bacterium]|jgi:L,D-peptidoglycan transpeptidase YkuD (ErfK/YbiS/YcfS/YnhG family)
MRVLAILLTVAAHAHASPCSGLANELASTQGAAQLVTVEASGYRTTVASLVLWERKGGCWRRVAGPWTARLGRNGLSDHKREGDGATPTGAYPIGATVYGIASDPGVHTAYHRLVCGDWWDEDPGSPAYNSFRHVPCGVRPPFGGGSEALWQATVAYRQLAVIEYNVHPVVPGRGSAIFLHDDVGGPTNGCISLPPAELLTLLRRLQPAAQPLIVIGTVAEIRRF